MSEVEAWIPYIVLALIVWLIVLVVLFVAVEAVLSTPITSPLCRAYRLLEDGVRKIAVLAVLYVLVLLVVYCLLIAKSFPEAELCCQRIH